MSALRTADWTCGYSSRVGSLVHMPPRGHYLASEVGRLAGVSGHEIGQWARYGYIQASQSKPGQSPKVYSYQDIAEAMVVHQLVDLGYSYDVIRTTLDGLRQDPDLGDWPLSQAELATAGADVVVFRDGLPFDVTGRPWHEMIELGDLTKIAKDLNRGGWAARELPDLEHIEINPNRLSGRPVIRGHRVPAKAVAELAASPGGRKLLKDDYELEPSEINDARRWWEVASRYEAA